MHIYFHIGAGKTGSSAIQHALAINHGELQNQGIYIPSDDLTEHGKITGYQVWWFENLKKLASDEASAELRSQLEATIDFAENRECKKVIFSAENLSNDFSWSALFQDILKSHEVSVCIYIRRQDDYLLSAWQQWGIKTGHDINSWLYKNIGTSGDWSKPIKEWQKIATNKLHVRVYQRSRLINEDVAEDFLNFLDVDTNKITKSKSNINSSFNIAVEELAMVAPGLFEGPHDNNFFNMVQKYSTLAHKKIPKESRLNASQRISIIERYNQSNQWIKGEYFSDLEGQLFDMPCESDYIVPSPSEIESKKWALITELVYGMHQKNK